MRKINDEQIINNNICLPAMGKDGNIEYETYTYKSALVGLDGNIISREYFYMEWLFEDHYIVGDITTTQVSMDNACEFIKNRVAFKFGVIKLNRDHDGIIIPNGESLVVPVIYDEIKKEESAVLLAKVSNKYTYIDMNIGSCNYGKQLVPAVLDYAEAYDIDYDDYAKCRLDGVVGYLPYFGICKKTLSPSELLSEDSVKTLLALCNESDNNLGGFIKKKSLEKRLFR